MIVNNKKVLNKARFSIERRVFNNPLDLIESKKSGKKIYINLKKYPGAKWNFLEQHRFL